MPPFFFSTSRAREQYERNVDITVHVLLGATLAQTAERYQLTPERIRQIFTRMMRVAARKARKNFGYGVVQARPQAQEIIKALRSGVE